MRVPDEYRGDVTRLWSGSTQELAELEELEAARRRFAVRGMPTDAYPLASLARARPLVAISSTTVRRARLAPA